MTALAIPAEVLVWKFGARDGNVRTQNQYATNTGYNLLCRTTSEYLTYVKQTYGINIGWSKAASDRKVHFRLPDEADREILTGEPVAFAMGGSPSFLTYGHQQFGIDLHYSETPKFEWRLFTESGEPGQPIAPDSWVAILNDRVQPDPDFLIYFSRTGANLGWTTSPTDWDSVKKNAVGAAKAGVKAFIKSQLG